MSYTPHQLEQIRKSVEQGLDDKAIAAIMGKSVAAIEHQTRGMRPQKETKDEDTSEYPILPMLPNQSIQKVRKHAKRLSTIIMASLDELLDGIKPYKIAKKNLATRTGDTLVIHLADLHSGKRVKGENGEILYNNRVFKTRMDILCHNILKLLDNNISMGVPITDVVIISTGDLANGEDIYPTQQFDQELTPPNQVIACVEVIMSLILALVDRKLPVSFYGVRGNHGRTGIDTDPSSNWDLMIYKVLKILIHEKKLDSKVRMRYAEHTDYLTFKIRKWKYLIWHQAPESVDNPTGRSKYASWSNEHKADVIVYGHYHHFAISDINGVTSFRGGSPVGTDDLAEKMARYSEKVQLVWGVTDERKRTFMYAVDLN